MTNNHITSPEQINRAMAEAETAAVAITRLFEDAILPSFTDFTLSGFLDAESKRNGGDRGAAALAWMEENFDKLSSICYGASIIAERTADALQSIPRAQAPVGKQVHCQHNFETGEGYLIVKVPVYTGGSQ